MYPNSSHLLRQDQSLTFCEGNTVDEATVIENQIQIQELSWS